MSSWLDHEPISFHNPFHDYGLDSAPPSPGGVDATDRPREQHSVPSPELRIPNSLEVPGTREITLAVMQAVWQEGGINNDATRRLIAARLRITDEDGIYDLGELIARQVSAHQVMRHLVSSNATQCADSTVELLADAFRQSAWADEE